MTAAADAGLNEAIALFRKGAPAEAAALCERLLTATPDDKELLDLLSVVEAARGRSAAAIAAAERLLALEPDRRQARANLGAILAAEGRLAEALPHLERAAALGGAAERVTLGTLLGELGHHDAAIAAFERAIALAPDSADTARGLGTALMAAGRAQEALPHLERAVSLGPDRAANWTELGSAYRRGKDLARALDCYRRALALAPDDPAAAARLLHQLDQACAWDEAAALRPRVRAQTEAALAAGRLPAEPVLAQIGYEEDPAANLRLAAAWANRAARRAGAPVARPSVARPTISGRSPAAGGRIRLGYLSHDFRDHAVSQLLVRTLELHDRASFEVFAYGTGPTDESPLGLRVRRAVDRFRPMPADSDRAIAEAIAADQVDILIDLNGPTEGGRLEIAALRPAPLQVAYLGFPGSSGAGYLDYVIGDRVVTPPDLQPFFSEALCRLPHCYLPTDDGAEIAEQPATRAACGLPAEGFVFASFNRGFKIDAETFDVWMGLLKDTPNSVLWLWRSNALIDGNLKRAAEARGVASSRLVFAERLPAKAQHLRRLSLADLALDTRIYNGHTTTCDCLWAGLPVLAILGRHFASRVSASLLQAVGLSELVTRDLGDYRAAALGYARAPERLAALTARLRANRRSHPLFDPKRYARSLEAGYRAMWDRLARGERPQPLDIED